MQQKGLIFQVHNVISDQDVFKFFTSKHLTREHPHGLLTRVIFGIALSITWRPGMLAKLKMHHTVQTLSKVKPVLRFTSVIAGDCVSKTVKGGLRACNDKPAETTI